MPFRSGFVGPLPVLLSLSACFLIPAPAEVHDTFANCRQFFLNGKPPNLSLPQVNNASICQRYQNRYRFATLHDRDNRIPIYSAYTYGKGGSGRREIWFVEPQLTRNIPNPGSNMERENSFKKDIHIFEHIRASQAVSDDYYSDTTIDRGHLNPNNHQSDSESRLATFTLTNVVPMHSGLNRGQWRVYEKTAGEEAEQCDETYFVTGAVPGNERINNRVNRPSHIWSAGCCVKRNKDLCSWGALASNNENTATRMDLKSLEAQLGECYKSTVDLFNSACYLHCETTTSCCTEGAEGSRLP